jgi:hypothetical protein
MDMKLIKLWKNVIDNNLNMNMQLSCSQFDKKLFL